MSLRPDDPASRLAHHPAPPQLDGAAAAADGVAALEPRRRAHRTASMQRHARATSRCVILGAGATGLAAAFELGEDALVVEREAAVGGACRSIVDHGFTFDRAGHVIWSHDPYVNDLYERLLADNVVWHDVEASMHDDGTIAGAADAVGDDDGAGSLAALIAGAWHDERLRRLATAYQRKLWGLSPSEIAATTVGDDEHALECALSPPPPGGAAHARFGYPLRGGFQALMNGFLPLLRARVERGAEAVALDPGAHELRLADGRVVRYEAMVSTIPLPRLVAIAGDAAPQPIRDAAAALRHVSLRTVNLGVGRPHLRDEHWIHYPGDTMFHRVFMQGNASPRNNAPGGFALTCEITYAPWKPLPAQGAALVERCIDDCRRVGLLARADEIRTVVEVDTRCAYVVCDRTRDACVQPIVEWLGARGITVAGRYGEWQQYGADHAFVAARRASERVRAAIGARASA